MRFTLIIPTIGRTDELGRLFESLRDQTLQDFEVIVSDQNGDDRVVPVIRASELADRITHVKSSGGASSARNAGIDRARGEIVSFPDDDCLFPPGVLKAVSDFFVAHPDYGLLTGSSYGNPGTDPITRFDQNAAEIEKFKIQRQGIEFSIFIRRDALGERRFDETMGAGSRSGLHCDEGPDLILRMQQSGVRCYYDAAIAIWHPTKVRTYDSSEIERAYRYALGTGYFYRKHSYPIWYCAYYFARSMGGSLLALAQLRGGKARFYFARCLGLWRGWMTTPVFEGTPATS